MCAGSGITAQKLGYGPGPDANGQPFKGPNWMLQQGSSPQTAPAQAPAAPSNVSASAIPTQDSGNSRQLLGA